jgi:enoyl-CoA hydratase
MNYQRIDDVAILRMDAGPANAITPTLLRELDGLLDTAEGDDASRGLVLTGTDRFFSAGLDLPFASALDAAAMEAFIEQLERTCARLFALDRPLVAAINGHAVAGGCVLALQADWRVMTDGKAKIGLNEVRLGLGLPLIAAEALRCQLSSASTTRVITEGELFDGLGAREIGLVNEVVPQAHVLGHAIERARVLGTSPRAAFGAAKGALRRESLQRFEEGLSEAVASFMELWFSDDAQALLTAAVASLKK